jgi:arsenate reductase
LLQSWLNSSFADKLINRRSTSWRQLTDEQRQFEGQAQVQLVLQFPTLIKRPVFVDNDIIAVGFQPQELVRHCL